MTERKKKKRKHTYYLPNKIGKLTLSVDKGHFLNFTNNDIQKMFSIVGSIVYGLMVDLPASRRLLMEFLEQGLELLPVKVETKNENMLMYIAGLLFRKGDYKNALYLYELILSKILSETKDVKKYLNKIWGKQDKLFEIIGLLNSIAYINAKLKTNINESMDVSIFLFDYLSDKFPDDNLDVISLKAAVSDTIGAIYLSKDTDENLQKAIEYLKIAHKYDTVNLAANYADPVSIRLTVYKIGEAYLKLGENYFYNKNVSKYYDDIHNYLHEAIGYFESIDIIHEPEITDKDLICAELNEVLNLSAKGILKAKGMLLILKESDEKNNGD
jgi:hypothetical protein